VDASVVSGTQGVSFTLRAFNEMGRYGAPDTGFNAAAIPNGKMHSPTRHTGPLGYLILTFYVLFVPSMEWEAREHRIQVLDKPFCSVRILKYCCHAASTVQRTE
jgi:hypothetical protein